jgi:hypothetical protein
VFITNLRGQTSWYASPVIADLDGNGSKELIAAYHSVYVFDSGRRLLADSEDGDDGRVYAPHVVVDLEGDGSQEIVVGRGHQVVAYSWSGDSSALDRRWVADTTTANNQPEVRGLAAADLDGDGLIEVVATTTQTASTEDGGAQVFVFDVDGRAYRTVAISQRGRDTTTARARAMTLTEMAKGTAGTAVTVSTSPLGTSMTIRSSRSSRPMTIITSKPSTMTASRSTAPHGSRTAARTSRANV